MAKAKSKFSFDVIKKNLFWVFVPLALLAMWGIFILANSKAKANYIKRMEDLGSLKSDIDKIKSNNDHPNAGTIEDAKKHAQDLRGVVFKAWEEMYRAQKANCTWSTKLDPKFIARVENLKWMSPIQGVEVREWYNTFIGKQIPEFLELAKRRTVEVRVPDPNRPGEWLKDAEGNDVYKSIDNYVAHADQMIQQGARLINTGMGGGGGMGGMGGGAGMGGGGGMGGMGGGAGMGGGGGFSSFSSGGGGGMGGGMSGGGGMGGGMDMGGLGNMASSVGTNLDNIFDPEHQRTRGIVDWPTPEIFTIVTWSGPSPYSGQIWYAQEEVWVYESLINVVRKINDDVEATGPHNAAIKRIQAMQIGRNAANIVASPSILQPLGSMGGMGMGMEGMGMDGGMGGMGGGMGGMGGGMGGMGGGAGDMGGMGMGMGMEGMEGGTGAATLTEEGTMTQLKSFRYVDQTMKPLSSSEEPPFAEFNMMPVCLELIVDQRKIPEILVECANSTMPIDVKLVRYSPANARTGLLGGGTGGGMGGMEGGLGGGMSGGMGTGGMGNRGGMSAGGLGGGMGGGGLGGGSGALGAATEALSGFDVGGKIGVYGSDAVLIQIVGIIYIYNEPDPEKFASGASAKENGIDGGVSEDQLNQPIAGEGGVGTEEPPYSIVPPETAPEPEVVTPEVVTPEAATTVETPETTGTATVDESAPESPAP